jgi:hypothetical protein
MAKLALVSPPAIVTELWPGAAISDWFDESWITWPAAEAGYGIVTVPVLDEKVSTVDGSSTKILGMRVTRSVARAVVVPGAAEIVTDASALTASVVTVNSAEVAFSGTVRDAGTVAARVFELRSVTANPPAGAGPVNLAVASEVAHPPVTVVGVRVIAFTSGGRTVSVADRKAVPAPTEIAPAVLVATGRVVISKVAVLAPSGTVTESGTVAAGFELVTAMTVPPAGAALNSVTVPVVGVPPVTALGLRVSPDGATDWT